MTTVDSELDCDELATVAAMIDEAAVAIEVAVLADNVAGPLALEREPNMFIVDSIVSLFN